MSGEEHSGQREQTASVKFESQRQLGPGKEPEGAPGAGRRGRRGRSAARVGWRKQAEPCVLRGTGMCPGALSGSRTQSLWLLQVKRCYYLDSWALR